MILVNQNLYPHRVGASTSWAVLIGISEYASYPLRSCVSDVQLMEKYLTEDLSVPCHRVQRLSDPSDIPPQKI